MKALYTRPISYYKKQGEQKVEPIVQPVVEPPKTSFLTNAWNLGKKILQTKIPGTEPVSSQPSFVPLKQIKEGYAEKNRPIVLDPNLQYNLFKQGDEGRKKIGELIQDIKTKTGKDLVLNTWDILKVNMDKPEFSANVLTELESRNALKEMTRERLIKEDWQRSTGKIPSSPTELSFEPTKQPFPTTPPTTEEKTAISETPTIPLFLTSPWIKKPSEYYEQLITPGEIEKTKLETRKQSTTSIFERRQYLQEEIRKQKDESLKEFLSDPSRVPYLNQFKEYLDNQAASLLDTNKLTADDILSVYETRPFEIKRTELMGGEDVVGVFLGSAKEEFFSGLLKSDLHPETFNEEIANTLGITAGFIGSLWLTGGALKGASMLTKTGRAFLKTSPFMFDTLKSVGAFNIHGQLRYGLSGNLEERVKSVFSDTGMALGFQGINSIFRGLSGYPVQFTVGYGLSKMSGEKDSIAIANGLTFMALHGTEFIKPKTAIDILKHNAQKQFTGFKIKDKYKKSDIDTLFIEASTKAKTQLEIDALKESAEFLKSLPEIDRTFPSSNPINNLKKTVREFKEEFGKLAGLKEAIKLEATTLKENFNPTEPGKPNLLENGTQIVLGSMKTQPLTKAQVEFLMSEKGKSTYYKRMEDLKSDFYRSSGRDKVSIGSRIDTLKGLGQVLGYEQPRITDIRTKPTELDVKFAMSDVGSTMQELVDKAFAFESMKPSAKETKQILSDIRKTVSDVAEKFGFTEQEITQEFLRGIRERQGGKEFFREYVNPKSVKEFLKNKPSEKGFIIIEKAPKEVSQLEPLIKTIKEKISTFKTPEERSNFITETIKKEYPQISESDLKQTKSTIGKMLTEKKLSTEKPLTEEEISARIKIESVETKIVQTIKEEGGITIDLEGNKPVKGFAYSPYKDLETKIPFNKLSYEDILSFIKKNRNKLEQQGHHIGGWHNKEDGNVYLDVSIVGESNIKTLLKASGEKQLSVFDLENFIEVKTPYYYENTYSINIGKGKNRRRISERSLERLQEILRSKKEGGGEIPAGTFSREEILKFLEKEEPVFSKELQTKQKLLEKMKKDQAKLGISDVAIKRLEQEINEQIKREKLSAVTITKKGVVEEIEISKSPELEKIETELERLPEEIKIKDLSPEERKSIQKYFENEGIATPEEFRDLKTITREEYVRVINPPQKPKIVKEPKKIVKIEKEIEIPTQEIVKGKIEPTKTIQEEIKPTEKVVQKQYGNLRESRAYKQWQRTIRELSPETPLYKRESIAQNRAKAQIFMEQNPIEAEKMALGFKEVPMEIKRTSLEIVMNKKAQKEENATLLNELVRKQSLRLSEEGQSVAMQRGAYDPDDAIVFLKELQKQKMNKALGINYQEKSKKAKLAYNEKIKEVAKNAKKEIDLKSSKIKLAEEILKSIIC